MRAWALSIFLIIFALYFIALARVVSERFDCDQALWWRRTQFLYHIFCCVHRVPSGVPNDEVLLHRVVGMNLLTAQPQNHKNGRRT